MTGIDAVSAAMLASRLDNLLEGGISAGSAATQVGVPAGAARGTTAAPVPLPALDTPAPSAQTALSNVALTLDAISRFGGDATPVVIGSVPLLDGPAIAALLPALAAQDAAQAAAATATQVGSGAALVAGAEAAANADGADGAQAGAAASTASSATQAAANTGATRAATAATNAAVAALASALSNAVSGSGLFYESHLAQWLAGQRPLADLAGEPQQQLTRGGAGAESQAASSGAAGARTAPPVASAFSAGGPAAGTSGTADASAAHAAAGQFGASGASAYASLAAGDGANRLLDPMTGLDAGNAAGATGDAAGSNTAAAMATVHPATLPLVRQQLDLLATDQFRWAGEAWPGARLDWSIEPDASGTPGGDAQMAWRTRLTLSLPSLGSVDAELVLTGSHVVARLSASGEGAARLNANGDTLRQRLLASGLELGGLSIRAVDATPDAFDTFASRAAQAAYAQGNAGAGPAPREKVAKPGALGHDLGDFDDIDELGFLGDGGWL